MPNILLTTNCNLSCKYCFAKEKMQDKGSQTISMENVRKVISFLKRSDYMNFRMMGGEPTLHPHFQEIVKLAIYEGMHLDLLSNGTWPSIYNDLFASISPNKLFFLLNIDHPNNYPARLWAKIEDNLAAVSCRKGVSLSFNIVSKEPQYRYIFDLTERYQIRTVRLSFSLPVLGTDNEHLEIEEYDEISSFIIEFVRVCERKGVNVQLDNAVPLCIFTYEQAGELLLKGVLDLKRNARCRPIVDIGPDLSLWYCFCLSNIYNRHLEEFKNLKEIQRYYEEILRSYQDDRFPMDKCYDCSYRTLWECQGGCIAFSIDKNKYKNMIMQTKETDNSWNKTAILSIADNVTITRYKIPEETYVLKNNTTGAEVEVGRSFNQLFHFLDGRHTTQELMNIFLNNDKRQKNESAVDIFEQQIIEESFKDILSGFISEGFLSLRHGKSP